MSKLSRQESAAYQEVLGNFRYNLQTLRKRRGLTQRELGGLLRRPQCYICNLETGARDPNLEVVQEISQFFQVSIGDLLEKELRD